LRKVYLIIITVFVSFAYLFLTDSRIGINGDFLAASKENAIEKKLQLELSGLKQKILVPVENRNSYILDEQKISSYKDSTKVINNVSTKTPTPKATVKKVYKSRWKRR